MHKRICLIDGCETLAHIGGLCWKHRTAYPERMLPHRLSDRAIEIIAFIEEVVLPYTGDDCLTWPFTVDTYGYAKGTKKKYGKSVCRGILSHVTGRTPRSMMATHTCGNGHLSCVNPRHLCWKTGKRNAQDKYAHRTALVGETSANARITLAEATWAWNMRGTLSEKETAAVLGVTKSCIKHIRNKRSWPEIHDPNYLETMRLRTPDPSDPCT